MVLGNFKGYKGKVRSVSLLLRIDRIYDGSCQYSRSFETSEKEISYLLAKRDS